MPKTAPQTAEVPPWLEEMRRITGLKEYTGSGSNPLIMKGPDYIAEKYPHQATYCGYYTDDSIAWCGLTVAYCMAVADIEPVFGPTDTDRWMWAQAWGGQHWEADEIDEPRLGCVIVMQREGGGHVCLMEQHDDGSFLKDGYYRGRGGNQSDAVTVANQAKSSVIKLMWPRAGGAARPEKEGPRYESVVISSGHGKLVRGASGILDEVNEARQVVDRVAALLKAKGVTVKVFHDNKSTTQDQNLKRIVDFHNKCERDLDISVHFNAFEDTTKPMGTEVLWITQEDLAAEVSAAIADCGFIDRGPKERTDLYFLNNTTEPAILIETCFVDSTADAEIYTENFENICKAIADVIGGESRARPDRVPDIPARPEVGLLPPLSGEELDEIFAIVDGSKVPAFDWKDRGEAPLGYCEGMAVTWANVVRKHERGYSSALEMARAAAGDPDTDALVWYAPVFSALRMDNGKDGLETLRHLWTLLYGLGMRESSGRHCEGRDMSADNVSAETAEAGLFQMSWNAAGCSDEMQKLMDYYKQDGADGEMDIFEEGVECDRDDWACYGSGAGAEYQHMAKEMPAFACETAAIGLRNLRQHWGPINRKEVQVRVEVDDMLKEIQQLFEKGTA